MALTELIAATQAAAEQTLTVTGNTTVTADDLFGDEEIIIQIERVDGNHKDLWSKGEQVKLASWNNSELLVGPAEYNVIKPKTRHSVAVGYKE